MSRFQKWWEWSTDDGLRLFIQGLFIVFGPIVLIATVVFASCAVASARDGCIDKDCYQISVSGAAGPVNVHVGADK